MRNYIILILSVVMLTGCGVRTSKLLKSNSNAGIASSNCLTYSKLIGTWRYYFDSANTVVLSSDCRVTSSYCAFDGIMDATTAISGEIKLLINGTTRASNSCFPLGQTTCTYYLNESVGPAELRFTCDAFTYVYLKS